MRRYAELLSLVFIASIALAPSPAAAYLGPVVGLPFFATALAMLAVFSVSAVVVVTWPVRALKGWLRRRRDRGKVDERNGKEDHAEDKR